jgi:hypothetical protein
VGELDGGHGPLAPKDFVQESGVIELLEEASDGDYIQPSAHAGRYLFLACFGTIEKPCG